MRKFMLSMAAVFAAVTASAQVEVNLTYYSIDNNKIVATQDGVTVEFSDNNSMELKGSAGAGYIQAYGEKTLLKVSVENGLIAEVAVVGAHGTAQADNNFVMTSDPAVESEPVVTGTGTSTTATYSGLACTSVQWYSEYTDNDYVEISKVIVTLDQTVGVQSIEAAQNTQTYNLMGQKSQSKQGLTIQNGRVMLQK